MIDQTLIFDVGAHNGEDTEFYLKKGFKVVAVDAAPDHCAALSDRLGEYIDAGRLQVLNLCIAETSGVVDFFVNEGNSFWSTADPSWVARNDEAFGKQSVRTIRVQAEPLVDLFREFGTPRYCKIDIEGADLIALRSLAGLADFPPFLSLESEKRSWDALVREFLTLGDFGYRRFKLINQSLVPFQAAPNPPLEGMACDHAFSIGCSGLFGEELPGRWLDAFEAIEAYKTVFLGYFLNGDHGLYRGNPHLPAADWYDTHAAR
jgi:FkbM family methyltransferase